MTSCFLRPLLSLPTEISTFPPQNNAFVALATTIVELHRNSPGKIHFGPVQIHLFEIEIELLLPLSSQNSPVPGTSVQAVPKRLDRVAITKSARARTSD